MVSKIVKENERYMARVQKSLDAEKNAQATRRQRAEERKEREIQQQEERKLRKEMTAVRDASLFAKNQGYGSFWIDACRASATNLLTTLRAGGEPTLAERALRVRVYDSRTRKPLEMPFVEIAAMVSSHGVTARNDARAQARVGESLWIATDIADFTLVATTATAGDVEGSTHGEVNHPPLEICA